MRPHDAFTRSSPSWPEGGVASSDAVKRRVALLTLTTYTRGMRNRLSLLLVVVLAARSAPAVAQAPAATPPRIDFKIDRTAEIPPSQPFYMGREIAQTMHYSGAPWLVRESRQREEDCRQLIEALAIQPGQVVCDMGCGNGFYTLELAQLVGPTGEVYAVDIQPPMLKMLSGRAAVAGLVNIKPVLGTVIDPRLPDESIDMVLCVDVYHEFSHPVEMLARIRECLTDEGQLVLAEFRGEDPAVPIKPLHKMTKAQAQLELEANGFELAREYDRLPWQHLMFFKVRDEAAE